MLATMFLPQTTIAQKLPGSKRNESFMSSWYSRLLLLFGVVFWTQTSVFAQSFSATVSPSEVCDGQQVTFTALPPVGLPSGETVDKYEYDFKDGSPVVSVPSASVTKTYAPGTYAPVVTVLLKPSNTRIAATALTVLVYHLPIPSYILTTNDTSCFRANQFCLNSASIQNPKTPSNPLATVRVDWQDGNIVPGNGTSPYCHSYTFPNAFNITVRAIDTKGCYKDTLSDISLPLLVKPNLTPDFKWTFLTGPCYVSSYIYKNLTPVALSTLRRYTWDFGDGTSYTGTFPFDATEIAQYDTITAFFRKDGEFPPALILEDVTGCIDSTRKTPANTSVQIPLNRSFDFDIVTTRKAPGVGFADSVCIGSRSSSEICFDQTPISGASPGTGDFIWNFDDPLSMQLNTDANSWVPCHVFVGGPKTYFPRLRISNVCPTPINFTYYAAITLHDDKYLDKVIYANNDTTDVNSRPRLFADFIKSPTRVRDPYKLTYTGSYRVAFGDTVYTYKGAFERPLYYISRDSFVYKPGGGIRDTINLPYDTIRLVARPGGLPPDTFAGYKFWGYGVRILGPASAIEAPPVPVVINPNQKNQCGSDTVDFVNTSAYYKSRKIYRRWEFSDDFAPQCTSYSIPKKGFPQLITRIQRFDSLTYDNGKTWVKFGPDTTRSWTTAKEQFDNSDHYFIANGVTYPGKMPCNFSFDTLPRHGYPNWDTVYRWYKTGKDFMPWDPTRYSLAGGPGLTKVHPADTAWWGKPVYLDPVSGKWSLAQGTGPAPFGLWVRIDTMNLRINNAQDLTKGHQIQLQDLPDPFAMPAGIFRNLSGAQLRDTTCLVVTDANRGTTDTLCGPTALPGTPGYTFYEYAFRRLVQKCFSVTLKHRDTFNNETEENIGGDNDSLALDLRDCSSDGNVQIATVKPDSRGLDKTGSLECPGFSPNQVRLSLGGTPGVMPDCGGQSMFLLNLDSLADRMDNTPCDLDGFTGWQGGATAGGINRPPFFPTANFQPLPWTSAAGSTIIYHYGLGTGTPQPADTARGFITLGAIVGTGCKDSITPNVQLSQLKNFPSGWNLQFNNGVFSAAPAPNNVINAPAYNPQTGQPQFVPGIGNSYALGYNKVFNYRPVILFGGLDTLVDIQYTDCRWPKCFSDTVWYHNFLQIQNLAANFVPEPLNCRLRHKGYPGVKEYKDGGGNVIHTENTYLGEEFVVYYADSIQDSVKYDVWDWGDQTLTADSFWYSPKLGLTDGYFTNGVRRVRYNIDNSGPLPVVIDSTVWPIRARWIGDNTGLVYGNSRDTILDRAFYRIFNVLNRNYKPDSMIIQGKCLPNKIDTIHKRDTLKYFPIYQIVDTAMMFFPQSHVFRKTSWEVAGKVPGSTTSGVTHLMGSTKGCRRGVFLSTTVGIIDTFDVLNSDGVQDTIYCENEEVFFVDSLRYWRFDCQVTNVPNGITAVSKSGSGQFNLGGGPFESLQIDSADFWRQDEGNPTTIQAFNPVLPLPIVLINSTTPAGTTINQHRYNLNPFPGYPIGLVYWNGTQWVPTNRSTFKGRYLVDTIVPEKVYWDFGDGSPIDSSTRPSHFYKQFGRYKVTMASKDSMGFMDTCIRYVYVAKPIAKPVSKQLFYNCGEFAGFIDSSYMIYGAVDPNAPKADSVRYNFWWFGEDEKDTLNWDTRDQPKPDWSYNRNGSFRIKLAVETWQGCVDTGYTTVFINGPRPYFRLENLTDTIGCAPFRIRLINMADSIGKYIDPVTGQSSAQDTPTAVTYIQWGDKFNSQSLPIGRRDTIEFTYTDTGTFYIFAVGSDAKPGFPNQCKLVVFPDTSVQNRVSVVVFNPIRSITQDKQVVCVDDPLILNVNCDTIIKTYDYKLIRISDGAVVGQVDNKNQPQTETFIFDSAGRYNIVAYPDSLSDAIPYSGKPNCRINDTLTVLVVEPSPSFAVLRDTVNKPSVFVFDNTTDTSTNSFYEWVVTDVNGQVKGNKAGNNQDVDYAIDLGNEKGVYTVCLTSFAKGIDRTEACWDSVCQTIINTFDTDVDLPNVFSPNGDNKNDLFDIKIKGEIAYDVVIYNRWGAKVFESKDPKVLWNGTAKNDGGECPAGVYYFVFKYQLRGDVAKTKTGTVTLMR